MADQRWEWPYECEAIVYEDGTVRWTNHDHRWSETQTAKAFLKEGPASVYPNNSAPPDVVIEVREAVLDRVEAGTDEALKGSWWFRQYRA